MNKNKRVVIVANGNIRYADFCKRVLQPDDFIIAVDGGIRHLDSMGVRPHLMIGDFDSIDREVLKKYESLGIDIMRFPQDKDFTDTELALSEASKISRSILLIGAFGARMDHTLANIYLLYKARELGVYMDIIDRYHTLFIIEGEEKRDIPGEIGNIVSLIPLLPSEGITTYGLKYKLKDDIIKFGYARGISNIKTEKEAWIKLKRGALLVFSIDKEVENEDRSYK